MNFMTFLMQSINKFSNVLFLWSIDEFRIILIIDENRAFSRSFEEIHPISALLWRNFAFFSRSFGSRNEFQRKSGEIHVLSAIL